MSGNRDDGGPAYPKLPDDVRNGSAGMSLRDWFAGQVASGMAAYSGTMGGAFGPGDIAQRAYEIADALISERSKP